MTQENMTLTDAVAKFLREQRQTHGLTLDQIAGAARERGATWSSSTVSNLERGQATLGLPVLIYLALALGSMTGRELTIADLLGDAESIALTPNSAPVDREWLDSVLRGAALKPSTEAVAIDYAEKSHMDGIRAARDHVDPINERGVALVSLAEERAAKKLDTYPEEVQAWSEHLWGMSLEQESARRAGPGTTPQKRGRITRNLIQEIAQARDENQQSTEEEKKRNERAWAGDVLTMPCDTPDLTSREHAREIEDAQKADPF